MASEGLHEARELLAEATVERHRAIASLIEEFDAIDWYDQRIDATSDPSLKALLAHNRDEEKEHATMTLEWLRRRDPALDAQLRTYLFTTSPITEVEVRAEGGAEGRAEGDSEGVGGEQGSQAGSLGIGSLRGAGR